ncbi:hypothetical protein N8486_02580, partial [Akkermansiaceae bacterium]|nr:hypothetical protein [Akkermansiaceae bacterium]
DVYAVGAGTRPTNLPIRFSQGRQATQETALGVGFVVVPDNKTSDSITNSSTTTLRNYAERGRGHYKAMVLVVVENDVPKVTRMIKYQDAGFDSTFSTLFPEADIINAVNAEHEGSPAQQDELFEDASDGIAELFVEGAETKAQLRFQVSIAQRLVASLCSKRFAILTGLSGSGKTKIAQALARWLTSDPEWIDPADLSQGKKANPCYALVPVGADWIGNENILGYPDGLNSDRYFTRPALDLINHARDPEFAETPHFLILDEMNLSHVERYFSDLLSMIESGESITLYNDEVDENGLAKNTRELNPILKLPENLFIIGTVNVDETTYMFSPKVLDRANVIEFRVDAHELGKFLASPSSSNLDYLDGLGESFGPVMTAAANGKPSDLEANEKLRFDAELMLFFTLLREHGAEFGFRVANEASRFASFYKALGNGKCWELDPENPGEGSRQEIDSGGRDWLDHAVDAIVFQKLMPKLHGSKAKLGLLLKKLYTVCVAPHQDQARDSVSLAEALNDPDKSGELKEPTRVDLENARYKLSAEKVFRMWRHLNENGFTSFPEN